MEEDHASGDEAECEPQDSLPRSEALRRGGALPAVSSMADQLIGKNWVTGPEVKFNFLTDSPGVRSVMGAVMPSASEAAAGIAKLIGGDHLAQVGNDAFKLTELWSKQAGRVWDDLHPGPKPTELWSAAAAARAREASDAAAARAREAMDAAAARAREAMGELGIGAAGRGTHIAGAATPVWEGLSAASSLASSFLPAGPQPSVMSAFTANLAGKGLAGPDLGAFAGPDLGAFARRNLGAFAGPDLGAFAGPDLGAFARRNLGSPSWFAMSDHFQNIGMAGFSNDQRPWSNQLGASVFDGVTTSMRRYAEGLSSWMATTHRAAMDALWRAPHESVATMLQSFSTLAGQGVPWGWRALGAALRARAAVLRGDLEAIVRFLREWLGFKEAPHTLVDAASAVLLEEAAWLPAGLAGDDKLCPLMKKLTLDEHRNFRLLGDTQLRGRSVDSLDREVPISRNDTVRVPLVETVPAPPAPASADDITDPRLVWIFGRLTEREQAILRIRAENARNWPDTAAMSGATRAEVDNLRRKVKRLGKTAEGTLPTASARTVS